MTRPPRQPHGPDPEHTPTRTHARRPNRAPIPRMPVPGVTDFPAPADPADITREVLTICRVHGFALAGIAPAEPSHRAAELTRWLADGKHGDMAWLRDQLADRLDIRRILPGARAVLIVADQYATRNDPTEHHADPAAESQSEPVGRIARYARGRDYHKALKKRLHDTADLLRERYPGSAFRSFVDSAPVLEREHALRAGLGWIGKHTLLIHPRLGSYTLLGGFATTLDLRPPPEQTPVADACGTCTRCIDACPTGAITPYAVDATRCISYLTIEHRGPIDPALHAGIGAWIYGCDVCQEVCPHNSPREPGIDVGRVRQDYAARRDAFPLLELLAWTEDDRRAAFATSPMKRATLEMMKRNALIAAGNALSAARGTADQRDRLRASIAARADDPSEAELVRLTARRVLERRAGV